jgi:anti-sigma regulatory factor (Ser/Thr protein kinase)
MCTIDRRWSIAAGDFDAAARARIAFRDAMRAIASPSSDFDGAEIIFGELVTNALRHAGSDAAVRVRSTEGGFILEIRDRGAGFDLERAASHRPTDAEGGRGLMIAQKLGAELAVRRDGGACLVEARLPLICTCV